MENKEKTYEIICENSHFLFTFDITELPYLPYTEEEIDKCILKNACKENSLFFDLKPGEERSLVFLIRKKGIGPYRGYRIKVDWDPSFSNISSLELSNKITTENKKHIFRKITESTFRALISSCAAFNHLNTSVENTYSWALCAMCCESFYKNSFLVEYDPEWKENEFKPLSLYFIVEGEFPKDKEELIEIWDEYKGKNLPGNKLVSKLHCSKCEYLVDRCMCNIVMKY